MEFPDIFNFVEKQCEKYKIDLSHGVIHSRRCVKWVERMIQSNIYSEEEKTVAIYSAAIHDLCDKKYTPIFEAVAEIRKWLYDLLSSEMTEAVLSIIQTMSYSFLNQRKCISSISNEKETLWYPDHGKWTRAYHLARHADLLDGYHVGRCYLYNKHAHPEMSEENAWGIVNGMFERRMFRYVSDGWITDPIALEIVPSLEEEARKCLTNRIFEYNLL
jgi:hypothetical protein